MGFAVREISFLRHPLDTVASFVRMDERDGRSGRQADIRLARVLNAWSTWLARRARGDGMLALSYEPWTLDDGYRAEVAARLGLTGHAPLAEVPGFGGGSSFGGLSPGVAARDRLARWKRMRDHPRLKAAVTHPRFRDAMLRSLEGARPDALGATFADAEAADWLRAAATARRGDPALDRLLENVRPDGPTARRSPLAAAERRGGWIRAVHLARARVVTPFGPDG